MKVVVAVSLVVLLAPALAAVQHDATPRRASCFDTSPYKALARRELAPSMPGPSRVGPPANPQIGDTWDWYLWDLAGFPSATLEPCTVRGMGPNHFVVVRDADWNVLVDQADVDSIVDHFENTSYGIDPSRGIHSLATEAFGDAPLGLDNDPRTYILYHDFTISSDGFVGWADPYPDLGTGLDKSNECEVLYMNCGPDVGVDHDPSGSYMLGVLAHEYEHIVHRGYDDNESNWLDESMAEIAMYLFDPYAEVTSGFRANPDISVTLDNPAGSYGARYFWGMHLFERFGGFTTSRQIVAEPLNGIAGVDAVLGPLAADFNTNFTSWLVANWLDDPRIAGGLYAYDLYDYPAFSATASHATYPVGSTSATVSLWAGDYVRFTGFGTSGLHLAFDGADTETFVVQATLHDSTGTLPPLVLDLPLDAQQVGVVDLPAGTGHDVATLVVGAIAPSSPVASYTYSAEFSAGILLYAIGDPANPADDVHLEWSTSGSAPYEILRSRDAATLRSAPEVVYPDIGLQMFVDIGVLDPVTFYTVEKQ